MERLLVTGIDTVAGGNLALALADRCEVLGLYDRIALESPAVQSARWQADEPTSLASHFEHWQPQWLIHCSPLSAASWDAEAAETADREVAALAQMAALAEHWSCPLTILASDAVFCGPRMFHDERCPGTSNSQRALQQRAAERTLESTSALIVRTHAYGWSFGSEPAGFAELAHASLLSGRTIETDGRRYATPILVTDLAELLWRAHELRLQGLYHLAGAERTSAHRFVAELAASLGLLTAAPHEAPHTDVSWHDETSLNSKRARRALSASTPMLREGIDRFVAQAQGGWRSAWRPLGEVRPLQEMAA